MLLCSVAVERRPRVHFPPFKVDCYKVDGGKVGTIPNASEGVFCLKRANGAKPFMSKSLMTY